MRSTLSLLGLLGSLGLTATAALVACGDTVITPAGTGGQGGAGGAQTTTVATTTTTTATTTTTTTSTSTGPMTLCDQACQHASDCGVDVCSFAMIDCANPQTDCPAQCLLDANCLQILSLLTQNPDPALIGCITGCQGGAGGGGPGGSCQGCAFQSCGMVLQSCGTPECQAWQQCAQGCSDPQCFADCNAQNPGASTYYGDVYDCLCTSCETDCAMTADPCNQVIPGTGGAGGMGASGMGAGGMGMGGTGGMP